MASDKPFWSAFVDRDSSALSAVGSAMAHFDYLVFVAPGLMVTAIILFMGAVSGAHLNPAVSLAFALRGDFPWRRVPGYIVIQLIGTPPSSEKR